MRVSTIALVLAGLVAAGAAVWMLRPAPASPEAQVRAAVDAMTRAAREHDVAGVLAQVSEHFQSPELGGKPELRSYLLGELLRGGVVEARMLESRAESTGPGEVLFTGRLLLGGPRAGWTSVSGRCRRPSPTSRGPGAWCARTSSESTEASTGPHIPLRIFQPSAPRLSSMRLMSDSVMAFPPSLNCETQV